MSSYNLRTTFRFFFVFYFLYKTLPRALSHPILSVTDVDESRNFAVFGNHTLRCNSKCFVVNKSALTEMTAQIGMYRIVLVDLTLRKYVDNNCLNQTDSYNLSKFAEDWIWSTVNSLTHESNIVYQPEADTNGSSVTSFINSVPGQVKGKVACTFNRSKEKNILQVRIHSSINDLIANVLMEEVGELTEVRRFGAVLCYKEREQNRLYVCLTPDQNTSGPIETVERPVLHALSGFIILILVMSIHFSPVLLCLFSPTYVSSIHNVDLIVLDGPSHMSIRGWVANFVSKVSSRLSSRKLFFIFFLISVPILLSAFVYPYLSAHVTDPGLITPTYKAMFALGVLWGFRGLTRVFVKRLSFLESCFVCDYFIGVKTFHRDSELEDEIKQHLRIQPLIIAEGWYLFSNFWKMYWQKCKELYERQLCGWTTICPLVGLVVGAVPFALPVSLVGCLLTILILVFYSCPMSTVFDFYVHVSKISPDELNDDHDRCSRGMNRFIMGIFIVVLSVVIILPYAGGVSLYLLMLTNAFMKTLTTILSLENIPHIHYWFSVPSTAQAAITLLPENMTIFLQNCIGFSRNE